jgi:peptidyl-prolyl cis-trans isomerase C
MLREPLVHFLLAGLAVFAFSAWRGEPVDPASRTITVTEEQVTRLAAGWQSVWRRPPTPQEMDALIADAVKEEIYYREAQRLGLDEDDPIIRRRLRAKMEFLSGAAAQNAVPTDAELTAWIARNPARYASDARFSFDQIYLGQRDGAAAAVQQRLRAGADWRSLAAPLSLPQIFDQAERGAIARDFGDDFAAAIAIGPVGGWHGPVASGFGQHLVRIRAATPGAPPRLNDVRQRAENDWRAATLAAREARAYRALAEGYRITIERP